MDERKLHAGVFEIWLNTICPVKKDSCRQFRDGSYEWEPKPSATAEQIAAAHEAIKNMNPEAVFEIYDAEIAAGRTSVGG